MPAPQTVPKFDTDGFLIAGEHWSEELAREMAASLGIKKLTFDHWQVLHYLRKHYYASGTLPPVRNVCRDLGLARHCEEKLFGNDLKRAWRIAGLPNPGEEAKVYMGQKASSERL
jgi:tRNA 2-thiouridine synthesizing protein E